MEFRIADWEWRTKMKGTFFLGADETPKFEVRDMEFGPLGGHEVLVRNKACGICGTDVHIYHGEAGSADVVTPVVLGHEFSGVVEKVGAEVTKVKPGDHVAMDPNIYCNHCRPCRMGKKQNCENLYALGVNANGGFAEYAVCPDTQCFKVKEEIDFDVAAMAEPLACVLHGIDQAAIKPGQDVLVIGGGTIGVCRNSKNPQEAMDFIRWVCSEEVTAAMTLLGSVSPCRKTYENYEVLDTYPWLALSRDCISLSHTNRIPPNLSTHFDERRFLSILGMAVNNAISGTMSAEEALSFAAQAYRHSFLCAE